MVTEFKVVWEAAGRVAGAGMVVVTVVGVKVVAGLVSDNEEVGGRRAYSSLSEELKESWTLPWLQYWQIMRSVRGVTRIDMVGVKLCNDVMKTY